MGTHIHARRMGLIRLALLGRTGSATSGAAQTVTSEETARSVRRMLERLSSCGLFDLIAFGVDRATVMLVGCYQGTLKVDAENAPRRGGDVAELPNQIDVLPASQNEDRVRWVLRCMTRLVPCWNMRLKQASLLTALTVGFACIGDARTAAADQNPEIPPFRMQVWGYIVADFSARVLGYFELRSELERGLPARTITDNPAEIRRAVRELAKKIRVARARAKEGDIFTLAISGEFRKALIPQMNSNTWAAILDDNPGEFSTKINGTYPRGKPLSTVPPNILAVLPRLPEDIQYRFLGRHLILLDTRANVILDRIPYAIQSTDCDDLTCYR